MELMLGVSWKNITGQSSPNGQENMYQINREHTKITKKIGTRIIYYYVHIFSREVAVSVVSFLFFGGIAMYRYSAKVWGY